ncbi:MAG: adenylate/guanylate cyclase domain-containing protein [Pirellulaceae bacterium]|nr:adenylate/guanylate cyclase domain-containing protein [Pirellulaceae bacterium]
MPSESGEVTLHIYDGATLVASYPLARTVEVGRRQPAEPAPYAFLPRDKSDRVIIADLYETNISRQHLRLEPQGTNTVRIHNDSTKNSVALAGGTRIAPQENRVVPLPVACELGTKVLRIEAPVAPGLVSDPDDAMQSLMEPTLAPGMSSRRSKMAPLLSGGAALGTLTGGVRDIDLLDWLQSSMEVFHSAAASADFLPKAVHAAAQMVGLDTVAVLLGRTGSWARAAVAHRDGATVADTWQPSQSMLARVASEKRTFFQVPPRTLNMAQSLIGVQAIVAAPILDAAGTVIGVLYGEGRSGGGRGGPVKELEAKLFELLAYGVATGLARVEQEQKLIAERVKFEQFFTPELARQLEKHGTEMLAPRDADVTVLFCDIRGFSRISSRCPAALAVQWVQEVLSELSDCVADKQGVLIDFGGDSLEALWGAPIATPDHAIQACEAALEMRARMPALSRQWEGRLGEPTDVTIGIHSGPAQVGNIGSRRKFKYGAFGTTVNLASRVQGATKHIGLPLLTTKATVERAAGRFSFRRLCAVRTVNISEPVELFELAPKSADANWQRLKAGYEEALALYEKLRFVEAMTILGPLMADFKDDEPARKLLQRTAGFLGNATPNPDTIVVLDGK